MSAESLTLHILLKVSSFPLDQSYFLMTVVRFLQKTPTLAAGIFQRNYLHVVTYASIFFNFCALCFLFSQYLGNFNFSADDNKMTL